MNNVSIEPGSLQESIAVDAQHKLDLIRMYELKTIVHAVCEVAKAANTPGGEIKFDATNKMLGLFTEALFPELSKERDKKSKKLKKIMDNNMNKIIKFTVPEVNTGLSRRK